MVSDCSITKKMIIEKAGLEDYRMLAKLHYRTGNPGPYVAIYAVRYRSRRHNPLEDQIGIIHYSMSVLNQPMRRIATCGFFSGADKCTMLKRLNQHVRCIRRVIIEPRYRRLGLASWLVRETMGRLGVAMIEASATMGHLSGFFRTAGMREYVSPERPVVTSLKEDLNRYGIGEDLWDDPEQVERKIELLAGDKRWVIEQRMQRVIDPYGRRRKMKPGIERTEFILSRLCMRPVYYAWLNPEKPVRGLCLKEPDNDIPIPINQ